MNVYGIGMHIKSFDDGPRHALVHSSIEIYVSHSLSPSDIAPLSCTGIDGFCSPMN